MSISFNNKNIKSPVYKNYPIRRTISNTIKRGVKRRLSNRNSTDMNTIYLTLFTHSGIQSSQEGLDYIKRDEIIDDNPLTFYLKKSTIPYDIKIFNKVTFGKFGYENFGDDDAGLDNRNKYIYKYLKKIFKTNYTHEKLKKGLKDFKDICSFSITHSKKQITSTPTIIQEYIQLLSGRQKLMIDEERNLKIKQLYFQLFLMDINRHLYSYYYDKSKSSDDILLSKRFSYSIEESKNDFGIYIPYASGGVFKNKQKVHLKRFLKKVDGKERYQFSIEELLELLLSYGYDKIYIMDLSCNITNRKIKQHSDYNTFKEKYPNYYF